MEEIKLPHDHGQSEERVIKRLPAVEECRQVAEIFKLISDGTRLRILLMRGPITFTSAAIPL